MTFADFLTSYLEQAERLPPPRLDQPGQESDWLPVNTLEVAGRHLGVADVQFLPYAEDRFVVDLEPGAYEVQVRLMMYGPDIQSLACACVGRAAPGA